MFGCHFPCNDHSAEYARCISELLGYIDAVAASHPGARLCILGDLNFECNLNNQVTYFLETWQLSMVLFLVMT